MNAIDNVQIQKGFLKLDPNFYKKVITHFYSEVLSHFTKKNSLTHFSITPSIQMEDFFLLYMRHFCKFGFRFQ